MAVYYLQDAKLYVAEHDLSGDVNSMTVAHEVDDLDVTTFGSGGARTRIAGLESVSLSHEGFWDGDTVGSAVYDEIAGSGSAVTVCPTDGTAGEAGFIFKAPHFSYSPGGQVGDVYGFSGSASGQTKLVRGTILTDAAAAVTSSGDGSGYQVGAATAGQTVYASLHVIAASGTTPTLDLTVESDDNGSFTTPATQITFTQATAATSEWKTAAGPVTDDYWRVSYTLGGTSPSFTFIVTLGIK